MEWQIEGFTDKDYNVARRHANKGEDTCAYTVGMLIMELDAANEQIAKLKAVSPPSEGAATETGKEKQKRIGVADFLRKRYAVPANESLRQHFKGRRFNINNVITDLELFEIGLMIPASPSPVSDPPEECKLVAVHTGDGWSLEVIDQKDECVAILKWPERFGNFMTADDLQKQGFEIG